MLSSQKPDPQCSCYGHRRAIVKLYSVCLFEPSLREAKQSPFLFLCFFSFRCWLEPVLILSSCFSGILTFSLYSEVTHPSQHCEPILRGKTCSLACSIMLFQPAAGIYRLIFFFKKNTLLKLFSRASF